MLRALLVDDERLVRKHLRQLLAEQSGVVTVVGEAGSVAEAAVLAAELRPDVIFLDVQMPPASGFDLLPLLEPAPAVVFVTAHDQYAVRAFAASAVDYLLKPVTPERLALALEHVRHDRAPRRAETEPAEIAAGDAPPASLALVAADTLILRDTGRLRRVRVGEIAALVAEDNYTRVHLATERPMLVSRSMAEWETVLPSPSFLRVDRSLLVNLERVAGLDVGSRDEGRLTLDALGSPALVLGRVAITRLRAALTV